MIDYTFGNYGFLPQGKMKDQPLILLDLGIERRCRENYLFDNAKRRAYGGYLLQYTLRGCGVYETQGSAFTIYGASKAGAACGADDAGPFQNSSASYALPPGKGFFSRMPEESRYYLPFGEPSGKSRQEEWEFFYLHFDGPAAAPFFETMRALTGPVFSLGQNRPPVYLFFRLFEQCRRQHSLPLYEGGEFLYRFLTALLRELEAPDAEGSALICRASDYLKSHFATVSGIGEAARACQVSQEHLTRIFRAETGQTPLQYLTRLRIEHGLFLLLNTNDSIEKIAAACGFLSGNYFAKVFRRYLDCSPEEYRQRNRC